MSGIRFLHRHLGLAPEAWDTFPIICLLWVVDVSMHTPPFRCLPHSTEPAASAVLAGSQSEPVGTSHVGDLYLQVLRYVAPIQLGT